MKTLIVYDSVYGNTEQIARAIGNQAEDDTPVTKADQTDPTVLGPFDLLVVGSPTRGGRATDAIQEFLAKLPEASVKGTKIASFDTRYAGKFVKIFGFAADRIAESLTSKGGIMVLPPEPFYVMGKKGPLKDGEIERATAWAKGLGL